MSAKHLMAPLLVMVLGVAGCGTMGGGNQVENAIYATHRTVTNLDKNLEPSVSKLNENVAGLLARVDESDQQVKALQSTVEENTHKLNSVEKKLDSLTNTLYRYFRLSQSSSLPGPGTTPGAPSLSGGEVTVVPPPGAAPAVEPATGVQPVQPLSAPGTETPPPVTTTPPMSTPAAPAPGPASSGDPEADYQQAQRSYASENYAAALDQFNGFLQRYPSSQNSPNAQFWKAKSLQSLERYEEAVGEFTKLRTSYPTSVRVPYAMLYEALCHKKLGQTARATELLKEVVKNYPMTPAADQAKTELQRAQGN